MSKRRQERLSDLLKEELSQVLFRRMHDPRLSLCNITSVVLSPDYRQAKVYVSVLGSPSHKEECLRALKAAEGFFRHELGKMDLKQIPTLHFHFDTGAEYSQHIEDLLKFNQKRGIRTLNWDGLLLVNKPFGTTSHTVVQGIKNRLRVSKAGHLGTLDPIATGVFPVCLGKATRLAPFFMGADKSYLATFRFGFFTSTDDREGEQEGPMQKVLFTQKDLEDTLTLFQGEYDQTPPAFSAKKIKGKKAYQIARRGMKPNLPSQKVKIHEIRLLRFEKDNAVVSIHCGTGTYVRSIARDLGIRLKCGAHVKELVRTKFNQFELDQCCAPDVLPGDFGNSFIPMDKMLLNYPGIVLNPDAARRICTGSAVEVEERFEDWARIMNEESRLIAMARMQPGSKNILQPKIVLS